MVSRPKCRALVRPADTTAEPNHRNLTGRAEPPPRVPPVHSVQPLACKGGSNIRALMRASHGRGRPQTMSTVGFLPHQPPTPSRGAPQGAPLHVSTAAQILQGRGKLHLGIRKSFDSKSQISKGFAIFNPKTRGGPFCPPLPPGSGSSGGAGRGLMGLPVKNSLGETFVGQKGDLTRG